MEVRDFLINPTDSEYQRWLPGTHIRPHSLKEHPKNVGNVIYMDEFIGEPSVKMIDIVIEAESGKKITWRLKKFIRLPIWFALELAPLISQSSLLTVFVRSLKSFDSQKSLSNTNKQFPNPWYERWPDGI